MPDEIGGVEEAKRVLATIQRAYEDQGSQLAKNGEAIADLKRAVQSVSEAVNRQSAPVVESAPERAVVDRYTFTDGAGKAHIRSVGALDDNGVFHPGLLDDIDTHSDWQREMQTLVNRRSLVRLLGRRGARSEWGASPQTDADIERMKRQAPDGFRRIFADSAGIGAEWIPDVTLPEVDRYLRANRRVEGLFRQMPMQNTTLILPKLTGGLRPYVKGAVSSDDPGQYTGSNLTTSSKTLTAKSFAVRLQVDDDAAEDSIIAVEGIITDELGAALVDGFEDGILNGDTAGTHQDTGIAAWDIRSRWGTTGLGTSADHRKAFIGLRARAADVSNTVDGSGTQTYAGLLSQRASLDSPMGLNDCIVITSPEYYLAKMLNFSEILTLEKFGPGATILTGQVASIGGMPVIISEFMDKQLNATGVYDDSTKTYTGCLVVNRGRFFVGQRRGSVVEVDRDATRGINHWIVTARKTFDTPDPAASKKNVSYAYKLSVS